MRFNKLLERQIKKYLCDDCLQQEAVMQFINAVNNSYNAYEKDQLLSSHAFKISEQEYAAMNEQLMAENKLKKESIKNIKAAISNVEDDEDIAIAVNTDEDNLLGAIANLNEQISKRKKVEQELKDSRYHLSAAANRLSQLIANLHHGILLEDENRNIVLTNQLFCDMFNIPASPESLKGVSCKKSAEESKHLFKQPAVFVERMDELLRHKELRVGDELEMTDGRILQRDFVPIYDNNVYKGHLWTYNDITGDKEREHELERLSLVASANENGVGFCSASGVIDWANKGFLKLTGYSLEEVVGRKAVDLCIGPLSDLGTIKKMLEAFYAGKAFSIEVIHYRKDGTHFWGRLKGQAIKDKDGNVKQYFSMLEDITAEKEKEEQLRVLSLIAEDNINAVIISDARGRISWVNKSFTKVTGYQLYEVKGKTPSMMQGPDTNTETIAYLRRQIAAGNPFNCEILNYTKSGQTYWVRVLGQAIRNSKGELTGFFALEENVSKEKEDQQKLKDYESRFRQAFEKIGDNVWEHDFTTGETYFSNTKSHLLGYDLNEFADNVNLWWKNAYDDDRHLLEENDAKYKRGAIDHHILEYRIRHKDGSVRWVMDRGVVIESTPEGLPLKIIGTHTDITERKNAEVLLQREEQKYRSIIANMNLGLMEVDLDEKVIFVNQSFCDMSEYSTDEIIGKKASDICIKEKYINLVESKKTSRKQGISDAYEIEIKNKSGQTKWWLVSGAPRYNDNGELVGSIGIHLDITDRKQLETELIVARQLAEGSTKSKEVFLANMSHEIRTPMNAILGMANQLAKTGLDGKQKFYLDTINSASENLLVIINDILDLSKIEAGKLQLENIGFEPKEMVSRAMQVLMHRAEEKGITLTNSSCDEDLSPVLMGDPYRLNQVLLNLISNAIKFTTKGGVNLSCVVLKESPLTQTISVSVKDTGIGMDGFFVKSLFDKFSQEDVSVTRQYGGTGLGMSICKDLVELMGGEISVESTKGVGTRVSFIIEFAKGTLNALPAKDTFNFSKEMLAAKTILVVDDNKMNRLVAKTILGNYGAVVIEAVNGSEAIDLLAQPGIDVVLMDIQMPVMGGMEATEIIRKTISQTLPIIALTANAIKGDNEKYLKGGMNAYLSKPFKEFDLLNIVASSISKK
ncbi:MAG: luxQ 5 [Ferruginibacter sp.]|uniref:PAS domain-containing hybrid sensor histidine kinase/response regulator n=1 Tax=Ferruginibacter sp. TaxID=1940288 RepID=UPI00265B183B|nr:PAS domain-containing hybrid sensor histidine kinase/response regulator [Ferruginibacter sp.]MDB5276667.1 luxQ 5 [Ferruginibacter sp.]